MMLFVRQIIKTKNTRRQNGSTTLDMPVKHADAWISKAVKGLAVFSRDQATLCADVFAQGQELKVLFFNVLANLSVVVWQGGQQLQEGQVQACWHDAGKAIQLKHGIAIVGLLLNASLARVQNTCACTL